MATQTGSSGNDTLDGTADADSLNGAAGNDTLRGLAGDDTLIGGAGTDLVTYANASGSVVVSLAAGTTSGADGVDSLSGFEQVSGSGFADTLIGGSTNETLNGGDGADSLDGAAGNDSLAGGNGNDTLVGGTGLDLLRPGLGNDIVDGSVVTDRTNYSDGNTLSYAELGALGIVVDLSGITGDGSTGSGTVVKGAAGISGTDSVRNVTFINLSQGDDRLTGSAALIFEMFSPEAGNDTLDGGAMVQTLFPVNTNRLNFGFAPGGITVDFQAGTASGAWGNKLISNFNQVRGSGSSDLLQGSDSPIISEFFDPGTGGLDTIDGRGGTDGVRFDVAVAAVNVNLGTGELLDDTGNTDTLISIEYAFGTPFNDTLVGSSGANSLEGRDGHDTLAGGLGDDTLSGGAGLDLADYGSATGPVNVDLGIGSASGADGNDVLFGINAVLGSAFNDTLTGGGGVQTVSGGAGDDLLLAGSTTTILVGGPGNDTLDGGSGNRGIYQIEGASTGVTMAVGPSMNGTRSDGLGGTDTLINIYGVVGTPFADAFTGDDGDNYFAGAGGNDTIDGGGGSGIDFVSFDDATGPVTATLANGSGSGSGAGVGTDTLTNIEGLRGGLFNDTLTGGAGNQGLAGNSGNDVIDGGDGDDTLRGNEGNDTLAGGAGIDWVYFDFAFATVSLNLASGTASGDGTDSLSGIENALGSTANDSLFGSSGANTLDGSSGNDSLRGGDGDDLLLGGTGGDSLRGDAGNDTLDGGVITDRINYTDASLHTWSTATGPITVDLSGITGDGSTGSGTVQDGLGGTDVVRNVFTVIAGGFNDSLLGSTAYTFEQFDGGAGDDTIDGGAITDSAFSRNSNRVSYASAPGPMTVDLADSTASGYGNDRLFHINQVRGSAHADVLRGSDNTGANFTEHFEGREGDDLIDGRGGNDTARYDNAPAAVNVNLALGTAQDGYGWVDTLIGIENVRGSDHADVLTGGHPANGTTAIGNALTDGLERFVGEGGNDTIDGGQGFDRVEYSIAPVGVAVTLGGSGPGMGTDGVGGTDTLLNIEGVMGSDFNDTLTGSDAAYEVLMGRGGSDLIDGRGGIDVLDFTFDENQGANVNLGTGVVIDGFGSQDTVAGVEWLHGTRTFGDTLTGNDGDNRIDGDAGNDTLAGSGGNDTLVPGTGLDSVDGGAGTDVLELPEARSAYTVLRVDGAQLRLTASSTGEDVTFTGIEQVRFSDGVLTLAQLLPEGQATAGNDPLTGTGEVDRLDGGAGNDTLLGLTGSDVLIGGPGNDRLDGGTEGDGSGGYDVASYAGATAVTVNLANGTATQGSDTDTLISIEAIFGSDAADVLQGADGAATRRGETLRGGGANDTIEGGTGVDTAEWLGPRSDYVVTQINATTWTVRDVNLANGDEGTDTVTNIERFVFADQMLSFGTRAEDIARVAIVLWSPAIMGSTTLFSRGYSFYDVGYSYAQMSQVALQFWTDLSDADLAAQLVRNSGSSKTAAQLLATLAANGGGNAGRAAMVREAADDPATLALLEQTGVKVTGVVSDHFVPDFGTLFGLLPG